MNYPSRKNVRAKWHDYGSGYCYFITICTVERQPLFGRIKESKLIPFELGTIVESCWGQTLQIRKELLPSCHVTMPNHFHALIGIGYRSDGGENSKLSNVVNNFKGAITRNAKQSGLLFPIWQRNYHEHIVRDQEEYDKIYDYIINNPSNWEKDKFFIP